MRIWEEINSRAGVGGVEEQVDSDQASLQSYCLSWFSLTLSGSFGQVNENSPGRVWDPSLGTWCFAVYCEICLWPVVNAAEKAALWVSACKAGWVIQGFLKPGVSQWFSASKNSALVLVTEWCNGEGFLILKCGFASGLFTRASCPPWDRLPGLSWDSLAIFWLVLPNAHHPAPKVQAMAQATRNVLPDQWDT